MPNIHAVCQFLDSFAPRFLAEEWDNTGLLIGDRDASCERVMTCLTITPDSAAEAIDEGAGLIVTHHPLPFRAMKRITTDSVAGELVWNLARAGVAVYSPHTSFDSAIEGINQRTAIAMGLENIRPLKPNEREPEIGGGRFGECTHPRNVAEMIETLKSALQIERVQLVGDLQADITKAATACGAAGEFLGAARREGCQLFVTGETNFHTCLEAEATGIHMILTGHYASERFAVEELADVIAANVEGVRTWASNREHNPLDWV